MANAIKIDKMILKKDSAIDLANINLIDLVNRLEEDSSFSYVANGKINIKEKYGTKRVYFNQDNEFYWWSDNGNSKIKVLGDLKKGAGIGFLV